MITLIIGGSGSGKSAYAEQCLMEAAGNHKKFYIATMQVYDKEGQCKVKRHRRMRDGKGFVTIEQPTDIIAVIDKITEYAAGLKGKRTKEDCKIYGDALLECMSNLVANEMFSSEQMPETDIVIQRIIQGIEELSKQLEHLVIVSNNVFEDGIEYDETTLRYIETLGKINARIAEMADHVVEVVVGIPVIIK